MESTFKEYAKVKKEKIQSTKENDEKDFKNP